MATLDERRSAALKAAQEITGKAVGEGRGLTEAERADFTKHTDEVKSLDEQIKAANEDAELMKALGGGIEAKEKNGEFDGDIGSFFTKSPAYAQMLASKGSRFSASADAPASLPQLKATLIGTYPPPRVEAPVPVLYQRPTVASLFGTGSIGNTSLTYWQQAPITQAIGGNAAPGAADTSPNWTAEGGTKPNMDVTGSLVTEVLAKLAGVTKISEETREDAPAVESLIRSQLLTRLELAEEYGLLSGPGGAGAINGLLNRSGVQTIPAPADVTGNIPAILQAMTLVRTNAFLEPDAIVVHPLDYQNFRLSTDANGQYFGGGPFTGAYGNGGIPAEPALWGLRTVVTTSIPQGTVLVGAFAVGGQVYRKGGVRVEMTNSNEDDFINNLIAIRAEERLLLAVYYPAAFCTVTLATA